MIVIALLGLTKRMSRVILKVSTAVCVKSVWVGLNTSIDWEECDIQGPVYIGSGSRIEAGATIIGPTYFITALFSCFFPSLNISNYFIPKGLDNQFL